MGGTVLGDRGRRVYGWKGMGKQEDVESSSGSESLLKKQGFATRAGAQLVEICFTFFRSSAFWRVVLVTLASKMGRSVKVFETWKSEEPGSELIAAELTGQGSVKMGVEGIGTLLFWRTGRCRVSITPS